MQQSNDFLPKSNFFNTLILCFFFFFFPIHAAKMSSFSFHHLCSIYSIWIDFFLYQRTTQHINTHIFLHIDEHFVCSFLFFYSTFLFMCWYECFNGEKHREKCWKIFLYVFVSFAKKIFCCCRRLLSMYMWSSYLYKSKRKTINGGYQILLISYCSHWQSKKHSYWTNESV